MSKVEKKETNWELYYIIPVSLLVAIFLYSPVGYICMEKAINKLPEHKPVGYYYYQSLEEQGVDTNQLPSWYKAYKK